MPSPLRRRRATPCDAHRVLRVTTRARGHKTFFENALRSAFNGTHYHHDTPLPGAVAYVQRLHGLGAHVVYLTGRKAAAEAPTRGALVAAGFPVGERTTLLCKPDPAPGEPKLETAEWKGLTARGAVAGLGAVVAAFDNEPVNCNALRAALPGAARLVFLDTLYKPDSPALLDAIVTIRDYQ